MNSIAFLLGTGKAPGKPMQVGHKLMFVHQYRQLRTYKTFLCLFLTQYEFQYQS